MLTKKHIEKFNSTPPEVGIWNGNFKKATIECKCNKVHAYLELDSTIPELEDFVVESAKKREVTLWIGGKYCKQKSDSIPQELQPAILALRAAVEFTEEEKKQCIQGMYRAMIEFREAFYPNGYN